MFDDLHLEINRTGIKLEELQKTLSVILAKLINPNAVHVPVLPIL